MKKTRILLVSLAILFISVVSPYVAATDTPYNEIEQNVAEITGDTTEKINDHLTINYDEPFTVGDGSGAMPLSLTNTPLYEANIAAGIYRIKNESSDMYIDIHGPSSSGLIHQWTFSTSSSELWYIEPYILDTEYYIIQSMHYDLAFMGTFGFATNTDNVALNTIADPDGIMHSDSTLWKIYETEDGRFVLFPKANHSSIICLTAPSDDVGDELVQSSYYESDSQFWTLESLKTVENGTYFLQNLEYEQYLQIDDDVFEYTPDAIMEIFDLDGSVYQKWEISYLNNGYYSITSYISGLALTAPTTLNGSLTQSSYSASNNRQQWMISKIGTDSYIITSKANNSRYVAVGDTSGTADKNVEIRNEQTDDKDLWNLERMLPLSGYEITYNNSYWLGTIEENTNCYGYALNNQIKPNGQLWNKQQPGEYAGFVLSIDDIYENNIGALVEEDFNAYNNNNNTQLIFEEVDRYEVCPSGSYKVALVLDKYDEIGYGRGLDYHWYRQDSDGLWSHKQGTSPVRRTDDSGDLIIDPQTADWGRYTHFIGYYAVTPWNGQYVP